MLAVLILSCSCVRYDACAVLIDNPDDRSKTSWQREIGKTCGKTMFICMILLACSVRMTPAPPPCAFEGYERTCVTQNIPVTMTIVDSRLFIGTREALVIYDFPDLEFSLRIDIPTSGPRDKSLCSGHFYCYNFITHIRSLPGDLGILACGSNILYPRCTLHQRYHPAQYTKFSKEDVIDYGYSSMSSLSFLSLLSQNGRFYSIVRHSPATQHLTVGMSPGILQRNTNFTVTNTDTGRRFFNIRHNLRSIHEYWPHIFIFLVESGVQKVYPFDTPYINDDVTKVARVCISDNGTNFFQSTENNFITFQKAYVFCRTPDHPYEHWVVVSTSIVGGFFYGAFTTVIHPHRGNSTAFCKFSVGAVNRAFGYYRCPGTPGVQRGLMDSLNIVAPGNITQNAFAVVPDSAVAMEAEEVLIGRDLVEVVYFVSEQGSIKQVVNSVYIHTVYEASKSSEVRQFILQHMNNHSILLLSTDSLMLVQIPRGECHIYVTCFSCFDSGDVYCGWDRTMRVCVHHLNMTSPAVFTSSFSARDLYDFCGESIFEDLPKQSSSLRYLATSPTSPSASGSVILHTTGSCRALLLTLILIVAGYSITSLQHCAAHFYT